jgi:hypothetical protein
MGASTPVGSQVTSGSCSSNSSQGSNPGPRSWLCSWQLRRAGRELQDARAALAAAEDSVRHWEALMADAAAAVCGAGSGWAWGPLYAFAGQLKTATVWRRRRHRHCLGAACGHQPLSTTLPLPPLTHQAQQLREQARQREAALRRHAARLAAWQTLKSADTRVELGLGGAVGSGWHGVLAVRLPMWIPEELEEAEEAPDPAACAAGAARWRPERSSSAH